MRYEDASHTGAFAQGSEPDARNDADALTAGNKGPATGNVITGEGTQTGPSGSDYGPGAHITSIAGAGGEDSSFAGGKLGVSGEFGRLSIDAEGNYSYQPKANTPENSVDRFTYTLADSAGAADTATLTIEIGKTPAVIKANAQQVVPGPDGTVILPPGVELSDVHIVGRNLVIDLPDGSQMVIIDGAVFVPQLVLGGVEVPATNLAALLVGQEIAPAAGEGPPQSSGGNFNVPVPPLDPGVPLGDLIPPTEYGYQPPEVKEVFDLLDEEPEAGTTTALLDDDAQQGGNPLSNVGDDPGGAITSGLLPGSGGDGSLTWDLQASGVLPGAAFSFAGQPNGDVWILQNGVHVLTISITDPSTGAYEIEQLQAIHHPDGGNENNLIFTINYTVTDDDGDVATGTLNVDVDDDMPTVSVQAGPDADVILTTDDADTDGVPTDSDTVVTAANFSGVFGGTSVVFGADGAGPGSSSTYALAVTGSSSGLFSHGSAINLFVVGGVVYGTTAASAGAINAGNTIFTVSTTNTGEVTLTQFQQIDHTNTDPSPTGDPYADHIISMADGLVTLTRSETAVDGDNDSVTGSATVNIGANLHFTDDGPTIDPTLNEVGGAVVDESEPVEAATIPLADGYTRGDDPDLSGGLAIGKGSTSGPVIDANAAFGADGPANGGGISYDLEVLNSTSGLTTTDGTAINLVEMSNGVVIGVVDGTTTVAFAITIDSGTGVVTVEQYLSIFHSDSPDNFDEPAFLDEGSLGVTVTATDFDGDSVTSDAVDITGLIRFEDDGPSATPTLNLDATVTVDETPPSNTPGIDTGGIAKGDYPDLSGGFAIGQANSGSAIVDGHAVFGADGPADSDSLTYSLAILDADSGLALTDGTPIDLQLVNGVIVGVVDGGTFDGKAAFAISIDSTTGIVSVEQYLSLDHDINPDPNDPLSFGEDVIGVTVTATDGDGDQITSDAVDVGGQITFLDDGPAANNDSDTVSNDTDTAVGNVITGSGTAEGTTNADNPGADGFGGITGLVSDATDDSDADPTGGFDVTGDFGTLHMDASGQYTYTRDPASPGDVSESFTYTYVDGDGDPVSAVLTITINDSAPDLPNPDLIRLDDDVIPGKNGNDPDGPGDDNPDGIGNNVVNGQLSGTGGDGTLTYNFTGADTLPDSSFSIGAASDADTLLIVQDQNGSPVTVMTIQLDQSDGSFTVTQNNPILHPTQNGDPTNDNTENNLTFSIGVEVEDADHDVEPASITINVDDDTPTINVTKGADAAVILTTDDADTIGTDTDNFQTTANFAGVFGLTQSAGADGTTTAATLSYALDVTGYAGGPAGIDSGLDQHGSNIYLYEIGGKVVGSTSATLAGVLEGNTVFDVSVNGTGQVTLTQYSQIDHPIGSDPSATSGPLYADHIVSMVDTLVTLTASATLTDKDGDTVTDSETVNIGANLHFTDDGPDAATSATVVGAVTLDESAAGTDRGPGAGAPLGDASETIDFSVNFVTGGSVDYGADGAGSVSYALSLTGTGSGLYALDGSDTSVTDGDGYGKGAEIQLSQVGNTISGKVGTTTYFTITIDPDTGVATFTQVNNIWHPTPGTASFDETATLTMATADLMKVIQTVTDFDGDTDTASINIGQGVFGIQDDGPQAIQPDDATVEDTAGESALGVPLDDDGSLLGDFGTDLPGKITFANITPGGMATTETADDKPIELWLSADGQTLTGRTDSTDGTDGTLIYTVHINANGTYDFILNNPIDNGSGFEFNNLTSTKAGTTLVYGIGADAAGSPDIDAMLTGTHSGVNSNINTNATSIGIANQSFNPTDAIRIDFVTNMDTNAGTTIGFDYTAHVETNGYQQKVPQVVGNPSEVSFKVWAIESDDTQATYPDSNPVGGFGDPTVTITEVWVVGHTAGEPKTDPLDISGLAVGDPAVEVAYGIFVSRNADGSVTFSGVEQNDSYGIGTGSNEFNAVAVEDVTGKFDLGIFALTTTNQGDPIDLAFDLNITDADGDTILLTDAINVTVNPAGADTLAAHSTMLLSSEPASDDTSSFSSLLASDTQQIEKTAANSNTTLLAAAVAASGFVGTQAAAAPGNSGEHGHQSIIDPSNFASKLASVAADSGDEGRSMLSNETKVAANDEEQTLSANHGNAEAAQSAHGLDNAAAHLPAELSAFFAAADHGPAVDAAAAGPVAPAVAMVSAEALQAAGLAGDAKHGGAVEKVLADALGHGAPPTVDGLLQAVGGQETSQLAAISHVASPAADAVPAWDMGSHGAFVPGADMMFKMGAEMLHHDAVQPVVNG